MQSRIRAYEGLAVLTMIILAAAFVYNYNTAAAHISSLKSNGKTVCSSLTTFMASVSGVYSNTTQAMQKQIQEDNSIIAALNSTRPSGYSNMIASLRAQVTQDSSIASSMNILLSGPGVSFLGLDPCKSFA